MDDAAIHNGFLQSIKRFVVEFSSLLSVLGPREKLIAILKTIRHAPAIISSRKLTPLDRAMSRNMTLHFHGQAISFPVRTIDTLLGAGVDDSYAFGTVREMFGNDVYLRAFKEDLRCPCVLDLGCNRGVFSLIAAKVLGAKTIIGVEPSQKYEKVRTILAMENSTTPPRTYWKMAGTTTAEQANSDYVSIDTIIKENNLSTIDFAKIDIEGAESEIFAESAWLAIVQNFAMELHPDFVNVTPVWDAVTRSGFQVLCTDQFDHACDFKDAMFLYASRTNSLRAGL